MSNSETWRGVQILDNDRQVRILNTPFLHNARIDQRDRECRGNLRKAARLMKSLKYDSEAISLTSYDIVAIAHSIPVEKLHIGIGYELAILDICLEHCRILVEDNTLRDSLLVPDGHRAIFAPDHATLTGLRQLVDELERLKQDVLQENARSFQRLAEARVMY